MRFIVFLVGLVGATTVIEPAAATLLFSTGDVNGLMASASRPGSASTSEIETADDFVLTSQTSITSATFKGLIPTGANVLNVVVEIYRVFPKDSTSPPSGQVPTRVNSPSDVAFDSRSAGAGLTISTSVLASSFTAANSVQPGGIHVNTGGNGSVTGEEVEFNVNFTMDLPADHYFFVPQVQLDTGNFFWLSSVRPIVAPGTPFSPDLQGWARDQALDPDWLRVGTDIVGGNPAPTFNFAFTLSGNAVAVPLPGTLPLFAGGLAALGLLGWRRNKKLAL